MGLLPQAEKRTGSEARYIFQRKICSRYVLLEICCASMVRYKVCRLLEHRSVGLSQARNAQPHACLSVYYYKSASFFRNGYEAVDVM